MRKPRVFVSHSTPLEDPARKGFLDAVCQALDAQGYHVLVDYKELKPGDWWYQRLNTWLADCDAAVVLLSRRAVSDHPWWVRHESSVLTWRKRLQPSFLLVPALLDDVTQADLATSELAPLKLPEFQNFRPQTAQEIADALGVPVAPARTPLEQWVERLADMLENGRRKQEDDALLELSQEMGIPEPPHNPAVPRSKALSREIARLLACQGLRFLFGHLNNLILAFDDKTLRTLLQAVAPAWISPGAAVQLTELSTLAPPWSAVINGNEIPCFTGRLYVQRAFWPEITWIVFHSQGAVDQSLDTTIDSILEDIRNHPKVRQRTKQSPDDFLATTKLRVFIVLHVKVLKGDLEKLQKRFPKATFLFSGGAELVEADWMNHPRLRVIRPFLDPEVEEDALQHYDDCRSALTDDS
jgi:hypothetical protein